ncbi:hypothetical protein [Burkholderia vietnamiensis]|uniref:hypothetical protein n=1 Tax=Burkholderia vietnamiensis TaxID=60552 RepID=UPI0015933821|nr:hypothetical protein [Burkholderia vietnamiensis]
MPRPLENPERKGDESLFSLTLNARCEYALMRLRVVAGEIGSPAFNHHLAEAKRLAARAGYLYAGEQIRRPDIEKLIDEKDWYALGLPFPEQILWSLKRGDRVRIRWHFLTPDVNSVTYDNPYGTPRFSGRSTTVGGGSRRTPGRYRTRPAVAARSVPERGVRATGALKRSDVPVR